MESISAKSSEKSPMLTKRIESIIEFLTYEIFRYTSRGLYENHKFLFVLMLALKIDMHKGKVTHEEFQIFIKGESDKKVQRKNILPLQLCFPNVVCWIHFLGETSLGMQKKLRRTEIMGHELGRFCSTANRCYMAPYYTISP